MHIRQYVQNGKIEKLQMIPERGPQTVFKQFLRGAINVLQSIECNLCCAT